ncbi:MAG: ATP-binding protein [Desulfobacterales bacterium]
MNRKNRSGKKPKGKSDTSPKEIAHTINLAIVGGGRACKFFLFLLRSGSFAYLKVNIVGVCDINPEAEGLVLAKELGIYTTNNFQDLFKIKNLDSIIELTGSKEVLLDIIRLRPKEVGVIEHNIGRLLRSLFEVNQRLKSTEEELDFEKKFSDFLIQQSSTAIVIINTDFTIVETNEAYLQTISKLKEDVIGAYCYEISHGFNAPCSSSQPGLKCPMVETLRTGKSAHVIHGHRESGEHYSFCDVVTYPLRDGNGKIFRVIEVWTDISSELSDHWETKVEELKSDLQKLIQEDRMISLGKLAASCVHEINNPIQGLLMFSGLMEEMLAEGQPTTGDLAQFKKYLSLMSRELERCGTIVSGLLSFSRESKLEYTDLDLREILDTAITLTRHTMNINNIKLVTDLFTKPLMVKGDNNQLQQCLLNLIFNAIEAMPDGGQLRVSSKFDVAENRAFIGIQDTGYGIKKEHLEHIFDPFFTSKEEGKGTGLGLSIVYGVVKNHQGSIHVDSIVGKGSLFTLSFPLI